MKIETKKIAHRNPNARKEHMKRKTKRETYGRTSSLAKQHRINEILTKYDIDNSIKL